VLNTTSLNYEDLLGVRVKQLFDFLVISEFPWGNFSYKEMEIYGGWQAAMACPKIYVYKEVSPHKLSEMNEYLNSCFTFTHPLLVWLLHIMKYS
jgi:hypothetical protein